MLTKVNLWSLMVLIKLIANALSNIVPVWFKHFSNTSDLFPNLTPLSANEFLSSTFFNLNYFKYAKLTRLSCSCYLMFAQYKTYKDI